jgi:hypothetical protein
MASEGRNFVLARFSASRLITELSSLYHALLAGERGVALLSLRRNEGSSKAVDVT